MRASSLSRQNASPTPKNRQNAMIGKISPLAMESKGFVGIMFSKILLMLVASAVLVMALDASLRSSPLPGENTNAHPRPMTIAKSVVSA